MAFCTLIQTVGTLNWKTLLRSCWTTVRLCGNVFTSGFHFYMEQVLCCFSIHWWRLSCFLGNFWGEQRQSQVPQNYFVLVLSLPSPFHKELLNGGNAGKLL